MSEDNKEDKVLPPQENTPQAKDGKGRSDMGSSPLGKKSELQDSSPPLTKSKILQIVSAIAAAFQKVSSQPPACSLLTSLETSEKPLAPPVISSCS